jgi:hypothetical protein
MQSCRASRLQFLDTGWQNSNENPIDAMKLNMQHPQMICNPNRKRANVGGVIE